MSRRKFEIFAFGKLVAPAVAAIVVVSLTTMNGCTSSDQTTEGRDDEAMSQAAAEAEAAEAQMAQEGAQKEKAEKVAAKETGKPAKTAQAAKPAKEAKDGKEAKPTRGIASRGSVYVVQVGAFKVKENAEKLQAKLKGAGYSVEMQTMEHSKNGVLHLVRLEPTPNRAEAETMVEDLHAKQDLKAQLIPVASK